MKNIFNTIQQTQVGSNVFDLTHDVKMSCGFGKLFPTCCFEAVPGDRFNISCESLVRFAPLIFPVMHRMDVTMHYFFVPNRLVWDNWEKFIVGTSIDNPVEPTFPTIIYDSTNTAIKSLANYLGVPVADADKPGTISAIPFAAYQAIYNEYYRDQNLVAEVDYHLQDGDNTPSLGTTLTTLRYRAWEHDYFTSCLPFSQKGASVTVPFGGFNDVPIQVEDAAVSTPTGGLIAKGTTYPAGTNEPAVMVVPEGTSSLPSQYMYAKTSAIAISDATIVDLRRAYRLQEWLEKNARGGSRYIEHILAHFGVRSSDARLNRPEYITGTKSPVVISEVLNTSGGFTAPQGAMAGHGISVTSGKYGNFYCEEHGFIIGIMSILPKTSYQQGLPRHFFKTDPLDYYWPSFQHIGEQEVFNKEIYMNDVGGSGIFGYIPRYAEYKFIPSRVAGDFQDTLKDWTMTRIFTSAPDLNQAFIEANVDRRNFAVTDPDEDLIYCHILHKVHARRKMAYYANAIT